MSMAARFEDIWWRQKRPPTWLLWVSHLYDRINRHNLARRASKVEQPILPLISVGNITAGGSGKTPFVIWLCDELKQRGYKPVVLCRGDGGRLRQPKRVLPDDAASHVGDEALLLALRCNAPVIAGRDRIASSRMAASLGDVMILDDGFQYLQLRRDCDIVLVPTAGIGNAHQLPAGPLREPLSALQRCDLVVRTGDAQAEAIDERREWRWQAEAQPIRPLIGAAEAKTYLALAGIARPQRFFKSAAQAANIAERIRFADHHRYTVHDVARILKRGLPVLTTEKDAVKLLPLWPKKNPLSVLPLKGTGEEGLPEAIIRTMLSHRKS